MTLHLEQLSKTRQVIAAGIDQGLHLGAQLYLCHHGEEVEAAFGEDRPGTALDADRLMAWMSSCKPITAVALAQLWERGQLDLDDPVVATIPEFASGGKEAITLRHLLTHTGGIRMLGVGWPELSWSETLAKICATRKEPNWEPGERAGYHTASSWFILGEVVQRLAGKPFATLVRSEIFEPGPRALSAATTTLGDRLGYDFEEPGTGGAGMGERAAVRSSLPGRRRAWPDARPGPFLPRPTRRRGT